MRHWLYGGTTGLGNLALLCRRHHVYVHEKNLTATITATGVTWHTWQHWRTTWGTGPPDLGNPAAQSTFSAPTANRPSAPPVATRPV
ncbi:MAG: hypothetical protein ABI112_16475 [Terracoccus sp.]